MKKIIVLIIVIMAVLTASCGKKDRMVFVPKHESDSLKLVIKNIIKETDHDYSVLYDKATAKEELADSLQKQLNICRGVTEPMTAEEENAALKKALADAQAKLAKRITYKKTPVRTTQTKKVDITEASFSADNSFNIRSVTTTLVPEGNSAPASTQ